MCTHSGHSRRRQRAQAQTTVEFALICLPFFALLFAMIDYAQIYYYDNSLQNALREATRFATAGRIIQTTTPPLYQTNSGVVSAVAINDSAGMQASRNECIRYWFQSNCVIKIPITNITIFSAPDVGDEPPSVVTNNGILHLESGFTYTTNGTTGAITTNSVPPVAGPGNAGDYVEVTATYTIKTITPLFTYLGGYNGRSAGSGYLLRVSAIVKNEPALLNFQHTNMYTTEPNENPALNQQ
jgi:Flp pilus assembly protein TadG